MKNIYAPWRSKYSGKKPETACVFCSQFQSHEDEKHFIIKRYTHCALMLNLHPYNAGHVMVLPYQHTGQLHELTQAIRAEIMEVVSSATDIIKTTLASDGINMGMNIGKAAGGSIPQHLHVHIVPRWIGDTNFLGAIAEVKQISFDMHEIYVKLKNAF